MTALILILVLVGLVLFGLQRNHTRRAYLRRGLAGSTGVVDRDGERLGHELDVVAGRVDQDRVPKPGKTDVVAARRRTVAA